MSLASYFNNPEPDRSTSGYRLAAAQRARLVVGQRVHVNRWSPALQGRQGVIVTPRDGERVGEGDCAVLLDEWDYPLAFYASELEVWQCDE